MNNANTISFPVMKTKKHKYNKSLQINNTKDLSLCSNACQRFHFLTSTNKNFTLNTSKKSLTDTMRVHPSTPSNKPIALGTKIRYILRQKATSTNNSLTIQKGALPPTPSNNPLLMQNSKILNLNRRYSIKESIPKRYLKQLAKGLSMNTFNQSRSNVRIALVSKRYKKKLRLFSNDKCDSLSHIYTSTFANVNSNFKTSEAKDIFNSPMLTSIPLTPSNKPRTTTRGITMNDHMKNIFKYLPRKNKEKETNSLNQSLRQQKEDSKERSAKTGLEPKKEIEAIIKRRITNLLFQMKLEGKGNLREKDKKLRMDIKVNEYRVKETIDDLKRLQNTNDDNLKKVVFITKQFM